MSEKITAIVEEIKALSLLEVKELTDALKETFGVEAIAMGGPAAGGAAPAEAAEEKTEFDVVLEGFDAAAKIKVIKAVREVTGLGLADAKAAVEGAPTTLKEAVSKDEGEEIKGKIEGVGGKVALK
jgi:large subunit ribosomal protein L7/L12